MKAGFYTWVNGRSDRRMLRMVLEGEDWPEDWHITFADLASQGLLSYFQTPPPAGEGLVRDRKYQLADGLSVAAVATLLEELHGIVATTLPEHEPPNQLSIEDVRDYG